MTNAICGYTVNTSDSYPRIILDVILFITVHIVLIIITMTWLNHKQWKVASAQAPILSLFFFTVADKGQIRATTNNNINIEMWQQSWMDINIHKFPCFCVGHMHAAARGLKAAQKSIRIHSL